MLYEQKDGFDAGSYMVDILNTEKYFSLKLLLKCLRGVMRNKGTNNDICESFSPGYEPNDARYSRLILEVAGISEVFKALSDETRTKIIYLLSDQELCVCDLADILGMTLPAISHHLRLLRTMRLVKYRREGKQAFYSLDDDHIVKLIEVAKQHFAEGR